MSKEQRGEGVGAYEALSLGGRDQPKTKNRHKTKTWVSLERNKERSNERKIKNLKRKNKSGFGVGPQEAPLLLLQLEGKRHQT